MAVTYIAVTFLTLSLPKQPCNGGFGSETAIWIRKWLKMSVETSRKPQLEQLFKARAMGVVIGICVKYLGVDLESESRSLMIWNQNQDERRGAREDPHGHVVPGGHTGGLGASRRPGGSDIRQHALPVPGTFPARGAAAVPSGVAQLAPGVK